MPPKIIKKEKLQAVVLTDSFQDSFMPLTFGTPRCLLPLANVPLIEYTLESLANGGVDEVYLMCSGKHFTTIQKYINDSKWTASWSPFAKIQCRVSQESRCVGDLLRELDGFSVITNDFVLVSGDIVTNINLAKAVSFHKKVKEQDRDHIVTMVLTEASATHRTRGFAESSESKENVGVFILDESNNNKCLYYEGIPASGKQCEVQIDPELLEDIADEFVIRNDLIDCQIDICSPIVPAIYQENFDYQDMRMDFVKGILTFDLLKRSIHVYISQDSLCYGARAANVSTYKAITKDLIERFAYPVAPELYSPHKIECESNHVYKGPGVVLAQTCTVLAGSYIGERTKVEGKSCIKGSVLGSDVLIGENSIVEDSILFDGVKIGANCVVRNAIIGTNTECCDGAVVGAGCVVGANCVIDNDIGENAKIVSEKIVPKNDVFDTDSESESENDEVKVSVNYAYDTIVGTNGKGYIYDVTGDISSEDSDDESSVMYKLTHLSISDESISSLESVNKGRKNGRRSSTKKSRRRFSSASASASESVANQSAVMNPEAQKLEEELEFFNEAQATIERAVENNHDIDTAVLELNTLRMSMNVSYGKVRRVTLATLLKKIRDFVTTNTLRLGEAVNKVLSQWGVLFKRQIFDADDEVDMLVILQEQCAKIDDVNSEQLQVFVMKQLYDLDLVEEENILRWYNGENVTPNKFVDQFVEWLQSAESESEEDSDSD